MGRRSTGRAAGTEDGRPPASAAGAEAAAGPTGGRERDEDIAHILACRPNGPTMKPGGTAPAAVTTDEKRQAYPWHASRTRKSWSLSMREQRGGQAPRCCYRPSPHSPHSPHCPVRPFARSPVRPKGKHRAPKKTKLIATTAYRLSDFSVFPWRAFAHSCCAFAGFWPKIFRWRCNISTHLFQAARPPRREQFAVKRPPALHGLTRLCWLSVPP